jgi:small subunit ribosomal protein S4
MARRKNIWSKIILPFYGNITQKQFRNIKNKIQRKKSESLSREDLLINKFENRLDVVVYRLNLAPNIFWARELIKNGVIFVTAIDKTSF